jgi:acetolactate synthase-1/3 small subunit
MSTHTLSLLVENRHGALSRIANLFSSRGYNISSLNVAETEDETVSRMTIVVGGDEDVLEQVVKQLNKLIDVIKVIDFKNEPVLHRELLLVRIDSSKANRHELITLAQVYGARIAGVSATSVTLELTADSESIEDFVTYVKSYGIKEMVRSGKVAIAKARK